jgi:hemerythrin
MKQSRLSLSIIISFFIFFALIIAYGGQSIFEVVLILTSFIILMLFIYKLEARKTAELIAAQKAIIFALASLAEWRDSETGNHLERTRNYGVLLARRLRNINKYAGTITDEFIEDLYIAAPLHDIGKVGIRDSVLLKEGKLTDEEFDEIKKHVLIGKDILDNIIDKFSINKNFLIMSRDIACYHHEKFIGGGYPEGLKGEAIPLVARIYSLCDAYDAIRSKRPYKEPISHEKTIEIISAESGKHFDPDVVNAFIEGEKEFMEVYETYRLFVESGSEALHMTDIKKMTIEWNPDLSVGVEFIDHQHQELFDRINRLLKSILQGQGREEVNEVIKFLENYVVMHFGEEEKYMLNYAYPDYASHLSQHVRFMKNLAALKGKVGTQGVSSSLLLELNRQVVEWLINHISIVDKALGTFLKDRPGKT